ncbi:MAG: hypothetical protein IT159_09545 [Bryobacterales bacterium]|nr:hypothetical protein [Bryobacterales bacterium]
MRQSRSFLTLTIARRLRRDYIGRLRQRGIEDRYELLSDRERKVLRRIAKGRSNKGVANPLSISLTTVETHRAHILQKPPIHGIFDLHCMRSASELLLDLRALGGMR